MEKNPTILETYKMVISTASIQLQEITSELTHDEGTLDDVVKKINNLSTYLSDVI